MAEPKLIHHADGATGQCSYCKEKFSVSEQPLADLAKRKREAFETHIREKHPELLKEDSS
jgi:hypothetical protein